jgi:phosphatidate phosphatase APP1
MDIPTPIQRAIGSYERRKERIGHALRKRVGYFDPIRVVGYNGFGTAECAHIKGRVLADDKVDSDPDDHELEHLANMFRRYHTDEVPEAHVRVTFGGQKVDVQTGWEGFFDVDLVPDDSVDLDSLWHEVELELLAPKPRINQSTFRFSGAVQIPTQAEFGIISDLDDTVLETGATDFFRQARIVLLNGPSTRVPFPGVAAFYHALQYERGRPANPIFYISSSPWNFYDLFAEFLDLHNIPRGSLLLKEHGFDEDRFIKTGHEEYKQKRIQYVLDTYPDLQFVLIGDSGQKDPEIYRAVVEDNPGRIRAIYVRDVSPNESRVRDVEVNEIAHNVQANGVDMLLVDDTFEAARHARRIGLLDESELDVIRQASERDREEQEEELSGVEKFARRLFS